MTLELRRVVKAEDGAFGVMLQDGEPFAVTLERTYEGNEVKIPAGRYTCTRTWYHRGGFRTYEIHVPGHDRILFHPANTEDELDGCVAVAEKFAEFGDKTGVGESRQGFREFLDRMGGAEEFELLVTELRVDGESLDEKE